ncbi:hypothetical protein RHMOL_Rhmol05G0091300 [Rhododendron molle]|uniref:Uncharacterized protein n=1 Tax=Rhododendron molle TaxID=49168 RepID=A0ACC0NNK5_RHOML|nr:hypothetical protein RHMOL_Rhmol05G0091300 [Rhododendron molle]
MLWLILEKYNIRCRCVNSCFKSGYLVGSLGTLMVGVEGLQILKPLAQKRILQDGLPLEGPKEAVDSSGGINLESSMVISQDDVNLEMVKWMVENFKVSVNQPVATSVNSVTTISATMIFSLLWLASIYLSLGVLVECIDMERIVEREEVKSVPRFPANFLLDLLDFVWLVKSYSTKKKVNLPTISLKTMSLSQSLPNQGFFWKRRRRFYELRRIAGDMDVDAGTGFLSLVGSRRPKAVAKHMVTVSTNLTVSMESNGKGVSIDGVALPYESGEITRNKWSTQLLPINSPGEVVSNHAELMSNFLAQPNALAYGKVNELSTVALLGIRLIFGKPKKYLSF